jgi:hypothetical protein
MRIALGALRDSMDLLDRRAQITDRDGARVLPCAFDGDPEELGFKLVALRQFDDALKSAFQQSRNAHCFLFFAAYLPIVFGLFSD